MREVLTDIERWRAAGQRVALATVVATRRSAPRPIGSKLAVSENGELAGSVSGGCVENEVYGVAREVLDGGEPRLLTFGITDDMAFSVGLPCGGEIDVWVAEPAAEVLEPLVEIVRSEGRAVVFTDLEDGSTRVAGPGEDPVGDELLRSGHSAVVELAGRPVFADVYAPRRGCSCSARSTPPRRCVPRRSRSAGARSSPMRARDLQRRTGSRARTRS